MTPLEAQEGFRLSDEAASTRSRRSSRSGLLPVLPLLAFGVLTFGACGEEPTAPAPTLSLTVVPSTVTFSVVVRPLPECCTILTAEWTMVAQATASGDLQSVSITLRNPVTGYVYVDRRSDRKQLGSQAPTHLDAGVPLAIPQALLETMPSEFRPGEPLQLRLEVAFEGGGQTVSAAIEPAFVADPPGEPGR